MMRWWLDRGVDGFRMDVINMISKDVGRDGRAARRPAAARRRRSATARRPSSAARGSTSSCRDAPRGVRRAGRHAPHRRRDAGRDGRAGAAVHRPGARRGGHGVPVRARGPRPRRREVGRPPAAAARPQGLVRPLAGRAGRGRLELPLLGQPRPAAGGLPLRRRLARATAATPRPAWPRCCTCTAGRPTSTRARSSGMANYPFAHVDDFRDVESLNHYAHAVSAGRGPGARCSPRCGR